jgi:histidyl-tRNA synthetase
MGIPSEIRSKTSRWIDRRDKMSPDEWDAYGKDIGVTDAQLEVIKQMLLDPNLWEKSADLVRLFSALDAMGNSEFIKFNPAVVRGLDYYTGTVFEAYDLSGDVPRAIMGGGRYNNLLSDVGGEPLPATGFAMGDVVITLILESKGLIPAGINVSPSSVLVTVFDDERLITSLEFASELRKTGVNVSCYPEVVKLPKQFKYADRMGMKIVIVIGPDEADKDQVTIKDLSDGTQQTAQRKEAIQIIKDLLKNKS